MHLILHRHSFSNLKNCSSFSVSTAHIKYQNSELRCDTLLIRLSYNNFAFSPTLKGLLKRKCGKADRFLVDGVTNKLFKNQEEHLVRTGAQKTATLSDLAARNIQRGRDHGIK